MGGKGVRCRLMKSGPTMAGLKSGEYGCRPKIQDGVMEVIGMAEQHFRQSMTGTAVPRSRGGGIRQLTPHKETLAVTIMAMKRSVVNDQNLAIRRKRDWGDVGHGRI